MKITKPEDLRIGHWATMCCHLDLERVETEEQLSEIVDGWRDDIPWSAWETKAEALAEIAQGWPEGSKERDECLLLANIRRSGTP